MLSKNQAKYIRSLTVAKFRKANGQFIAEGTKLVIELINSSLKVVTVFALPSWIQEHLLPIEGRDFEIVEVTEREISMISSLTTPSAVLCIVKIPALIINPENISQELVLMLDDIKDPGNMGTIIRTADWFGIKTIICSENCVDIYNPKVVQATMGSIARISIFYTQLFPFLANLPSGVIVYGSMLDGDILIDKKLEKKGIIIIGNESRGISPELLPHITEKIKIPSFSDASGHAESLNASIATAIICYEFRRRN